jgi:hypothetical protein
MLRIDRVQTIVGVQVYADDDDPFTFYALAEQPRFRIDENGHPVLRFLEYREAVVRADGTKGGAFVFFDVEFVVDDAKQQQILTILEAQVTKALAAAPQTARPSMNTDVFRAVHDAVAALPPDTLWGLQDGDLVPIAPATSGGPGAAGTASAAGRVKLGQVTWAKGTASLNLQSMSGEVVEKVYNPGAPSLFGRNITPFTVELTQRGATLFAQALQGLGGVVQVSYDLQGWVKLPPVRGRAWFDSATFYEFHQHISSDSDFWSRNDYYQNNIREKFIEAKAFGVELDAGTGVDKSTTDRIRENLYSTLEKMIEEKMRNTIKAQDPIGDRDAYEVDFLVQKTRIESFSYTITENTATLWTFRPQGTLPNITSLGASWSDHSAMINMDDPFFRTRRVNLHMNAEFEKLQIDSIDAALTYGSSPRTTHEHHFVNKTDPFRFEVFKQGDDDEVEIRYTVNYKGDAEPFQSPPVIEKGDEYTINVDGSGVLLLDVQVVDLDITQIPTATVTVRYTPQGRQTIEHQFVVDDTHRTHHLAEIIHERRGVPEFKVDYRTKNGRLLHRGWRPVEGNLIQVGSPFTDNVTVSVRGAGDFEHDIADITVDLVYRDEANEFEERRSVTLVKDKPFADVAIPVINVHGGVLTYAQTIRRQDGTVQQEGPTPFTTTTLTVGPEFAKVRTVTLQTDLLDFTVLKLVHLTLRYDDDQDEEFVIRAATAQQTPWTFHIAKGAKQTYTWSATFFLLDGTKRVVPATEVDVDNLLVEMPGA